MSRVTKSSNSLDLNLSNPLYRKLELLFYIIERMLLVAVEPIA